MFFFTIKKTLAKGDGTYVGSGTVPPLFELNIVSGNNSMQIYVQNFTTLAAAKTAAAGILVSGTTVTWTDNSASTSSYSNWIARPASA